VPDVAPKAATASGAHDLYAQRGFTCEACHPCGKRDPSGHALAWMDLASPGFHAYDSNSNLSSCQPCHGAALDGVGGTTSVSCAQCHGATWRTNCTFCHGGTGSQTGAPPKTVWGRSSDAVRVGTHEAHLGATHALSRPVPCATCHVVPADALATGHSNGATADVTFSGLAVQGTPTPPAWNRTTATCSSTYCHGATIQGGTATSPVWTTADGSMRACNACHGAPPPAPHPANAACGSCHVGYSAATANANVHVDGKVDVDAASMNCSSCHGSATNAAPPAGTRGETATTTRAVGAHQAHLTGTRLRRASFMTSSKVRLNNGTTSST
jgi:predicted CxxxxCH...CXXCH cytochrome family protein